VAGFERGAADRILIDVDDALKALQARDGTTGRCGTFDQTVIEPRCREAEQRVH